MSETNQLNLPLLQAAQAQKHVTVNESLARLDAVAELQLVSVSETVPPTGEVDGAAYGIPATPVNDWDGHDGEIAVYSNGGWVFMTPRLGWRAWVEDEDCEALFDGQDWRLGAAAVSAGGAATVHYLEEFDHAITAGASNDTSVVIADSTLVFGVSGRVKTAITGSGTTGWRLGVAGSDNRYGSGLGLAKNSWARGFTGSPQAYWGGTALRLTAEGGDFSGGAVRLTIHGMRIEVPWAV